MSDHKIEQGNLSGPLKNEKKFQVFFKFTVPYEFYGRSGENLALA